MIEPGCGQGRTGTLDTLDANTLAMKEARVQAGQKWNYYSGYFSPPCR